MTFAKQNMFMDQQLLFASGPKVEIEVVIMTFNDIVEIITKSQDYDVTCIKIFFCVCVAEMSFQ